MKDMEIRGAGNLLGAEQHGHVAARRLRPLHAAAGRGRRGDARDAAPGPSRRRSTLDLPLTAFLPEDYVADQATRLRLYQRLAPATDAEAAADLRRELEDRFGALPEAVSNLLDIVEIKVLCQQAAVRAVHADAREVTVRLEKPRDYRIRRSFAVTARRPDCGRS